MGDEIKPENNLQDTLRSAQPVQETNPPEQPKHRGKLIAAILAIVIIVAGGAMFFYFKFKPAPITNETQSQTQANNAKRTIPESKTIPQLEAEMNSNSKLKANFPSSISQTDLAGLPDENLNKLIPADAENKSLQETTYAGGQKGYLIKFDLNLPLDQPLIFRDIFGKSPGVWTKTSLFQHAPDGLNDVFLVEVYNSSYDLHIFLESPNGGKAPTHIIIQVLRQ